MLYPVIHRFRPPGTCVLLLAILLASGEAGLRAYEEPRTANVDLDPAGIVLDFAIADRIPVLLIGLASDYPDVSDRQRAAALAVAMALHPDSLAAQAANRALATGGAPEGMGLGIPCGEAVGELWEIAMQVHAEALTEDERKLGLYLVAVVFTFAGENDPRFTAGLKLGLDERKKLRDEVLSGP